MYNSENGDKHFLLMHCFEKLEGCKKWNTLCFTINKDGAGVDGPIEVTTASTGAKLATSRSRLRGMRLLD
jgi:hypothetical protein